MSNEDLTVMLGDDPPDFIPKEKKKVIGEPDEGSAENQYAVMLTELKAKEKEFEEAAKDCRKDYLEIEKKLVALMVARGFDMFRIKGLATFSTKAGNHPSVTQANQEAFNAWLDANGMGAIAKRTVHPSTLKGWVNNWLSEGKPLPEMVSNFPTITIHIHKL